MDDDDAVDEHRQGQEHQQKMPPADPEDLQIEAVSHIDRHKAPQEAVAEGQHIWHMQAMPDVVCHLKDHAAGEQQQQSHAADPLPQGDPSAEAEQDGQHDDGKAAEDIGGLLVEGGGDHGGAGVGKNGLQGVQNRAEIELGPLLGGDGAAAVFQQHDGPHTGAQPVGFPVFHGLRGHIRHIVLVRLGGDPLEELEDGGFIVLRPILGGKAPLIDQVDGFSVLFRSAAQAEAIPLLLRVPSAGGAGGAVEIHLILSAGRQIAVVIAEGQAAVGIGDDAEADALIAFDLDLIALHGDGLRVHALVGGVLLRHIETVPVREFAVAGRGALQAQIGGDGDDGSHCNGKQGEKGDPPQAGEKARQVIPVDHVVAHKEQQHEDAYEQADIVIAEDGQGEADGEEQILPVPHQREGAQGHQGQQGHGVKPDGVPVVAHDVGAQGIGRGEEGDHQIRPAEGLLEKDGAEQAGQGDLQQHGQGIVGHDQALRQQRRHKIHGAGQIVGKQRQIGRPHAGGPGVQQRAALQQPGAEILIKGIVLVPLVVCQDHLRPEGPDPVAGPVGKDHHKGQEEGRKIHRAGLAVPGQKAADVPGQAGKAGEKAAAGRGGLVLDHIAHLNGARSGAAQRGRPVRPIVWKSQGCKRILRIIVSCIRARCQCLFRAGA